MNADHDARMRARLIHELEPHGIGSDRLTISYRGDLQDYDVLIGGGELSEEQISAVIEVVRKGGCVRFTDDRNTDRWYEALRREGRAIQMARAAELRQLHPDLPKLHRSVDTLADFARSLEIWCGLEPGSAFTVTGDKTVVVDFKSEPPALSLFPRILDAVAVFAEEDVDVIVLGQSED